MTGDLSYYFCDMQQGLNLLQDTLDHFDEGAKSVRVYSEEKAYIITRIAETREFWVTEEAPGFPKKKAVALDRYFEGAFGIEARY